MEKKNVVKAGVTRCDQCSGIAVSVSASGKALCRHCASTKTASVAAPTLKNFGEVLAEQHTQR